MGRTKRVGVPRLLRNWDTAIILSEEEQFMNSKIPRHIIQTGKSLDLPLLLKAAVANVRLLNPDFEYLF